MKKITNHENLTVHLISHNHWDREWIFTARYTNRWLPRFFANVFAMLEREPGYRFVLDGQTAIVEDYFSQFTALEAREKKRKLTEYVRRGQLLVGPSYLQPDWALVSGESLVRNLMIGHKIAGQLGGVMKAGWMLDNFGQIAQAPQIYRGFGIDGVFVWRGVDPGNEPKTEFWWESPDGSRVLAIYLINSYRNGMVLSLTREIALERIRTEAEALRPFATSPNVLLMNGYEQVPWPDDVLPIIEEFNRKPEEGMTCVQSTPPEYLEAVKQTTTGLPVIGGYFYSGRYMPVLKGVFSSRSHLKLLNNQCQRELERWAEPFAAIAWTLGADYPAEKLERTWKTLLLNHAHDDMCGCSIDHIARDMEERFHEVLETATDITGESLKTISQAVNTFRPDSLTAILIFNPSTRPRSEVIGFSLDLPGLGNDFTITDGEGREVPYQIRRREGNHVDLYLFVADVPSIGYKTYYVNSGKPGSPAFAGVQASESERSLENEFLKVTIGEDGTLDLCDKQTGQTHHRLGYFEDGGDAGDTYDYSWPARDTVVTSLGQAAVISLLEAGPLLARFRVEIDLRLPEQLTPDRQQRAAETRSYPIVSYVELTAGSHRVEVKTVVQNVVKDHRLRVMFPSGIHSDYCFAEEPFDIARLPVRAPDESTIESASVRRLMLAGGYTVPVNTHPFQNFVDYSDGKRGLAIISRRGTEYEILPEDGTIALTLLRCVGWLARYDLLTRTGDVGPHIFTPEAQCLGEHVFSYAIYPHSQDWPTGKAHLEAFSHNLPLRVVQSFAAGSLPDRLSFLTLTTGEAVNAFRLTALKRAESGDGLILRFFNTFETEAMGDLTTWWDSTGGICRTNLNEECQEELPPNGSVIHLRTRPKEIVTLKLRLWPSYRLDLSYTDEPKLLAPLPSADKPVAVAPPPLLTEEELQAEHERVELLDKALLQAKAQVFTIEDEIERQATYHPSQLVELQKKKLEVATLTRQLNESRISELLNRQLYVDTQIEAGLGEIGEAMSWSRTKKRAGEYLLHYYQRLLEQTQPRSGHEN